MAAVSLQSQPPHNFSLPPWSCSTHHANTLRLRKLTGATQKSPHDSEFRFRIPLMVESDSKSRSRNPVCDGIGNVLSLTGSDRLVENSEIRNSTGSGSLIENSGEKSKPSDRLIENSEKISVVSDSLTLNSEERSRNSDRLSEKSEEKTTASNRRPKIVFCFRGKKPTASDDVTDKEKGGALELRGLSVQRIKPLSPETPCPVASTRSQSVPEANVAKKNEKKRKFSFALTKEEIEEDILAMTGSKPRRRPKKRARNVQKKLDTLFPGLWLDSITLDSYKVPDTRAKG